MNFLSFFFFRSAAGCGLSPQPVLDQSPDAFGAVVEETLVVWTTEFGRTPFNNAADAKGREHHHWAFSSWMAGAGVKPGIVYCESDEYGISVAKEEVHVHDPRATILHLMELDNERLTFRHTGLGYRLTDMFGMRSQSHPCLKRSRNPAVI